MEEELKKEILRLCNLKSTIPTDVYSMTDIIKNNIDVNFSCCNNCVAQIKYAQRILMNYYNSNIQNEQIINIPPPPKKKGCSACKNKNR